ncbi:MAG: trypsin-like peptidase domain-containing protein [Clostridia bacterium]|nr:trypsin-like peptidase domain-containing protein [Clostridia bacterium]
MEDYNENVNVEPNKETTPYVNQSTTEKEQIIDSVKESPVVDDELGSDAENLNEQTHTDSVHIEKIPDVSANNGFESFNKITYTDKKPISNYTPFSKGLKLFCAALALVILLVGACWGGYAVGRNGNHKSFYNSDVKLDLSAKPKGDGMTAAEVYKELNPSIVGIRVYNSSNAFDASGVVYTKDGYIITNDHIYSEVGAPKFKIYTFDGKEYDAEYVAGDTVSDLAVLKIKGSVSFKVPQFGDSNELVCGEDVFAIGRPSDASDDTSITAGTVSLTSRRVKSKTNYSSRFIQTDSAINPGSSGGALSNMYGQVVGITSSKLAGDEYDRIGFAIPTVTVKRVVDQLISNGKVTDRAKLGITYTEINSVVKQRENRAATGLLVASVSSDSDLSGKVSKDDIITHVNGIEITKDDVVLDVIESSKPGDTIKLTVITSSGDEKEINAKLGANIGESCFNADESQAASSSEDGSSEEQPGGTFDFPFGE